LQLGLHNPTKVLYHIKYPGDNQKQTYLLGVLCQWINRGVETQPAIRGISVQADDADRNNLFWLTISSFLIPSSLYLINAEK
jgi:hypothetical protein